MELNKDLIKLVNEKPYLGSHLFLYIEEPQLYTNRVLLSDIEDEIKLVPYAIYADSMEITNSAASDSIFGYLRLGEGFSPGDDLPLYTDNSDLLRWFRSFDDNEFNTNIFQYPDDRDEIYCQLVINEEEFDEEEEKKNLPIFDDDNIDIQYPYIDENHKKHLGFARVFAKNGASLKLNDSGFILKEGIERLPIRHEFSSVYQPGILDESAYEENDRIRPNIEVPEAYIPKRAVNAYIASNTSAFRSEIDLLIWNLSLIKNKKLGFTTVLYIDTLGKELLEEKKIILPLYDEVYIINTEEYSNINLKDFWAVAKFHAMKEELKYHGTDFFIMDVDFSFMNNDICEVFKNEPIVFWDNREEFYWVYPELNVLSTPEGFKYPRYIDPKVQPINSALIRCTSKEILEEWIDIFFKFISNNPVAFTDESLVDSKRFNGLATWICTAEQRFLGCIIKWYDVKPYFFRTEDKSFMESHFHTWIFKNSYNNTPRLLQSWLAAFIALIYLEGEEYYKSILDSIDVFPILSKVLDNFDKTHFPPALKIYLKNN